MDRISAHNNLSFLQRLKNEGFPRLVSDLINPLFIPPVVIGIILWMLGGSGVIISWVMALALIFYTLIPLAATIYLVQTNRIPSMDLPERASRNGLFKLSIFSAAVVFLCFLGSLSAQHQLISIISFIFFSNALVGFVINGVFKISIHSAALSSAGAVFLFISQLTILPPVSGIHILSLTILLLLLPLMIWARYRLEIHTLAELFGGAITGFLLTLLQLSILSNIW